jgi:hypothetical protein
MRLLCTIHETVFKRLDKKLLQYFKSAVNFLYAKIINLKFFCLIYKKITTSLPACFLRCTE